MARTYTDDEKAAAVALCVEEGLAECERQTGIAKSTVRGWITPEDRERMDARASAKTAAATKAASEKRTQIRTKLLERAERMLDRLVEPETDYRGQQAREVTFPEAQPASAKALATTAAILIDKYRLEVGEVTDRTEHRSVDQVTAEVERLAAEMAER